jgi:hypothetical protein
MLNFKLLTELILWTLLVEMQFMEYTGTLYQKPREPIAELSLNYGVKVKLNT